MFDRNLHSGELRLKNVRFQRWNGRCEPYVVTNRPVWGILYLLQGSISYRFNSNDLTLYRGDVLLIPPDSSYEVVFSADGASDYLINFSLPDGEMLMPDRHPKILLHDANGTIASEFRAIDEAYRCGSAPYLLRHLFYRCMHTVATAPADNTFSLTKAAQLLCDCPHLPITEIAQQMHISRSLFQKRFRECFGISPIDYRNQWRIKNAKLLLETTELPIKQIADQLGFYDVAYFYKVFRTTTGLTPKDYRTTSNPLL